MTKTLVILIIALLGLIALHGAFADNNEPMQQASAGNNGEATAIFAGGCFWCMEKPFEELDGVKSVVSRGAKMSSATNSPPKKVQASRAD